MEFKLSEKAKSDISFLNELSLEGVITFPIDYETNIQTFAETADTLDLWLGGKKWRDTGHSFIQFGQDGCGSLFCLWFYPGLDGEPPVVFFGSEGERALVSNNSRDYIRQITSGKVFFDGDWIDPEEDEYSDIDWDLLFKKAKTYLGTLCTHPDELAKTATNNHPDISTWIESNVE